MLVSCSRPRKGLSKTHGRPSIVWNRRCGLRFRLLLASLFEFLKFRLLCLYNLIDVSLQVPYSGLFGDDDISGPSDKYAMFANSGAEGQRFGKLPRLLDKHEIGIQDQVMLVDYEG